LIFTPHTGQQNLTLRQDNNRLTGKTLWFSREDEQPQHHAALQMTNHNIVRLHESLKNPLQNTYKRENLEKISKKNHHDVCRKHRPLLDPGRIINFSIHKNIN